MTHTPGPCHWCRGNVHVAPGGVPSCAYHAAAPDLLAALKEAYAFILAVPILREWQGRKDHAGNVAAAAIARAEGK